MRGLKARFELAQIVVSRYEHGLSRQHWSVYRSLKAFMGYMRTNLSESQLDGKLNYGGRYLLAKNVAWNRAYKQFSG